jgi:glycosyltransferase involved in cell wall biosynthesis
MKAPLRILHTEWSDGWGGQERRVMSEMIGMRSRGYQVFLATRPQCRIAEEARNVGIPVSEIAFRGSFDPGSILKLIRLIRTEKIQIVNTHSGKDTWSGGLAAKLSGRIFVRTRHLNYPSKRNLAHFIHYLPDQIVTCGEGIRDTLIETYGFPPQQLTSIPTGIDFEHFKAGRGRDETRAELGIPASSTVVLIAGIIRGVKRHEIALRGLAPLIQDGVDIHLLIAGDGPMKTAMEQLASTLTIGDRAHFLGFRDDLPDLMQASDMLLLTSRSEGVPQVISQAMGSGLAVIATEVGGVPELIQHEDTGLLVPPESPEAVSQAVRHLLDHPGLVQAMECRARDYALIHLSLDAMLDRTESLYNSLLARQ